MSMVSWSYMGVWLGVWVPGLWFQYRLGPSLRMAVAALRVGALAFLCKLSGFGFRDLLLKSLNASTCEPL